MRVACAVALLLVSACSPKVDLAGAKPNPDAYFEVEEPAPRCGFNGKPIDTPDPGGTVECPGDKNREGCPCEAEGETAPCWPGLRVNRGLGVCMDGVTTCRIYGEVTLGWGACEGYVLPDPAATQGAAACSCFSHGTWNLTNPSFCVGDDYVISSLPGGTCPGTTTAPALWSSNALSVDCEGRFKLCYTLKAGLVFDPQLSDCVLHQSCVTVDYAEAGETTPLPAIPGWIEQGPAIATCIERYRSVGGYGEMSVEGNTLTCETLDVSFHRTGYCPLRCADVPPPVNDPACTSCGGGTSGMF